MISSRILVLAPLAGAFIAPAHAQTATYQNPKAPLEARVTDLMSRLTEDEKITLLAGTEFTTQPIPRLSIPPMEMVDAGQGVRGGSSTTQGPATAFPSGVAMASTWNPTLVGRVGAAIGIEAQNKGSGAQVVLGPAVNIHRSPRGGRNGEYFSEDPFLTARLGVAYIRGMQGVGTVASIKHFAANNQEMHRFTVDAQVSERALREIYLPGFEAGVKEGGAWTVMSSYNRLNGSFAASNRYLLTDILKKSWGFDGAVMSDWGGAKEGIRTVNAGNDLEMPGRGFVAPDKVNQALANGITTRAQIEENVTRIVRTILRSGVVDGVKKPNPALVNSPANRQIALQTAQESIVLLKNERDILPLDAKKIRSIAVIGPAARELQVGAQGSPYVTPLRSVGPLEGIQTRAGAGVQVRYVSGDSNGNLFPDGTLKTPSGEAGFAAQVFVGKNLEGAPKTTRIEPQVDLSAGITGTGEGEYSVRWTGNFTPRKSGTTTFLFRADDGCRLFLNDKPIIEAWRDSGATTHDAQVELVAGQTYRLRAEYYQAGGNAVAQLRLLEPGAEPFTEVVDAARQSDVAIVVVTTRGDEGEGQDRASMALPNGQDELVRRVVAANPKTIVVLNNGTPVSMPWLGSVPALVETWFPGQEGGQALAQILFGNVNPSGHLPTTFGARLEDYPDFSNYGGNGRFIRYEEGIYVGYRGFDKHGIAPLFPFGYGLSYTKFRLSDLKLSSPTLTSGQRLTAQVRVTNTGKRAGAEVVQLYVSDPNPKTDKAIRELKGFTKVFLQPGQSQIAKIELSPRDFAWCDVKAKGWRVDEGRYQIEIGDSSRNLTQRAFVRLANWFEPIPFMRDETKLPPREASPDLARGKRAFASSQNSEHRAELAFDDNIETRWQGDNKDNEWLAVDLGSAQRVGRVFLGWEAAYASAYRIEVSDDAQNWREVYSTTQGQGSEENIEFAPVQTRYVRVLALKRGLGFGASLQDFEVRAPR